jgi:hypothetical protein
MANYIPLGNLPFQFQDANGDNMDSGTIEFFLAGTSTPTNLFSDNTGTSIGTSITLNSSGYPESGGNVITLFRDASVALKLILKNAAGTTISSVDNLKSEIAVLGGTASGVGASLVGIQDSAGNFTATDVEGALAEVYSDLASTTNGLGASLVGVEDSAGNFTATDVEAALAEIADDIETGTFSSTVTGGTGGSASTFSFSIAGNICTIHTAVASIVTSNTTAMTLPDLPAACQPANTARVPTIVIDNDTAPLDQFFPAMASITTDTITFYIDSPFSATGFTASNIKGLPLGWAITYPLT